MRKLVIAVLIGVACGALANPTHTHHSSAATPGRPYVDAAELSGNNLFVQGVNFDENSTVYINYKRRETTLDPDSQGTILKVKKGGKRIRIDEANLVFVANADGQTSNYIRLFRTEDLVARYIQFPWQPEQGFIRLRLGGLMLVDSRGMRSTDTFDPTIFARITDKRFSEDGLRMYEVIRDGKTGFEIAQDIDLSPLPGPPPIIWRLSIYTQ